MFKKFLLFKNIFVLQYRPLICFSMFTTTKTLPVQNAGICEQLCKQNAG